MPCHFILFGLKNIDINMSTSYQINVLTSSYFRETEKTLVCLELNV
jgi:hypothetical protein